MSTTVSGPTVTPDTADVSSHNRRQRRRQPRAEGEQTVPQTDDPTRHLRGGRRGGRAHPARDAVVDTSEVLQLPQPREGINQTGGQHGSATASSSRRSRGGRGGRGGRHGGNRPHPTSDSAEQSTQQIQTQRNLHINSQGRRFGGELTAEDDDEHAKDLESGRLQADAPEFRPGQPIGQRSTAGRPSHPPHHQRRKVAKSTAPDIATRTHEDILNGHYECPICTNEVLRNSKAWSCRTCWTVFHLGCIKRWSTNEGSALSRQQSQDDGMPPPRQWRCPGCNLPKDNYPSVFKCWCEKEFDPKPLPGLPPFSCGQTCSRPHELPKKCPHPCPLLCHAGPCPPCTQMGPTQSCFCGRDSATRRCVDTDYDRGWSCGKPCGELMPCGEHECQLSCHEGLCGACEVEVEARCYCGQVEKTIPCSDRGDDEKSKKASTDADGQTFTEEWTGMFTCGHICDRTFDCEVHRCERMCHAQDSDAAHCPRSPDTVSHCPCGKTKLLDISDTPRRSCEDPIPNCQKSCHKRLPCGHACEQLCHSGECWPCLKTMPINCRCGRTTSTTICHQGADEPPQCMRICRVTLNCGRHECGDRCCPGERLAAERQSSKRKPRPLHAGPRQVDDGFEAEHICTRACGRTLKCGNHTCHELCHKGPCGSCREAIFDEVGCHCGRTVLQPPLPCGTRPPPCRFPCERPKTCGHPQVQHNCHQDDEDCPKCPFLTTKECLCGKNVLKNQQCWLPEARCGEICGRKLKCGHHRCRKPCHRPGDCEDAGPGAGCLQPCGKEKKCCGHPCSERCHSPYPCKEETACDHRILITCACQRVKQETRCNATKDSQGNNLKTLKCDDECARLERNRKLATALNIDPAHQDDHIPYATETLALFAELNSSWTQAQEKALRTLAADPDAKRLRFKPAPKQHRAFLHYLAEDFGFDSESMDPEPHRHVAVFKTPRFVAAPMKTLAESQRIRRALHTTSSTPSASTTAAAAARPKASNVEPDPYNAFLLTRPRFGLTLEDLAAATRAALAADPALRFAIAFLPSEAVVLKAEPTALALTGGSAGERDRAVDRRLRPLLAPLARAVAEHALGAVQLARVDASLNVLRRESDGAAGGGWSQVAAKAARAAPRTTKDVSGGAGGNLYGVLGGAGMGGGGGVGGGKVAFTAKKGKKRAESVVENWEEAEMREEEREREASGAPSSVDGAADGEEVSAREDIGGAPSNLDGTDEHEVEAERSGLDEASVGSAAESADEDVNSSP